MERYKKSVNLDLNMIKNNIFYTLKPYIPRQIQIYLRQQRAKYLRKKFAQIWPINLISGNPPEGWNGWPNGKKFALVLTHDVDTQKGHDRVYRLLELEERLGFRSSFNFVPEKYRVSKDLRELIINKGFEVGVHGLNHDGNLYRSKEIFEKRAYKINRYIKDWGAVGFRSPAMHHNFKWIHKLVIEYDASTFDTDPFEPQTDGMATIFPFWVSNDSEEGGYVELPYTLPQDHGLFFILKEKSIDIWKRKLNWIVECGGMVLLNIHPDYMSFDIGKNGREEYPSLFYEEFLNYIKSEYNDNCWHVLPKEMARFWVKNMIKGNG